MLALLGRETFGAIIEEFLLHLPFRENGRFLWLARVCSVVWDIWGERNDSV